jgi:hypothetical protein
MTSMHFAIRYPTETTKKKPRKIQKWRHALDVEQCHTPIQDIELNLTVHV